MVLASTAGAVVVEVVAKIGSAYLSNILTGYPNFFKPSVTSAALPTTITLVLSRLKYLLATRCMSSAVTALIFCR